MIGPPLFYSVGLSNSNPNWGNFGAPTLKFVDETKPEVCNLSKIAPKKLSMLTKSRKKRSTYAELLSKVWVTTEGYHREFQLN